MADPGAPGPRIGFLGPDGTFSHDAVLRELGSRAFVSVPLPSIADAVLAVQRGDVAASLVPIENTIEGSVNATLDTLVFDAPDVRIAGESVLPIEQCLIAAETVSDLAEIDVVVSHPQAQGQCARWVRASLPRARAMTASSTAEAVRLAAEHGAGWAALGNRLAAERYGCAVLAAGIEDVPGNATRFVWLVREGADRAPLPFGFSAERGGAGVPPGVGAHKAWRTTIVFWGAGTGAPGWLVDCLSALSERGVNLSWIESRPLKSTLGEYMFFVDCDGAQDTATVSGALTDLRRRAEVVRVIGCYQVAPAA